MSSDYTVEDYIRRVSWEEVGDYLNSVASRVDPNDFSGVYGIPRGGLVLAAWQQQINNNNALIEYYENSELDKNGYRYVLTNNAICGSSQHKTINRNGFCFFFVTFFFQKEKSL